MARLKVIFALALALAAANDSVDVVDGNTNGFDGAPCTAEQTQCDDGACCATANWCCYGVVPPPRLQDGDDGQRQNVLRENALGPGVREQGQRRRGAARRHRPTRPRRRARRRVDRLKGR